VNPNRQLCRSVEKVLGVLRRVGGAREGLPYEIGWRCVKVDSVSSSGLLGFTGQSRVGIAYKFPARQAVTTVEGIGGSGGPHRRPDPGWRI